MKWTRTLLLFALLLAPAATLAMDITAESDPKADFSSVKTFAFKTPTVESKGEPPNPLTVKRVMEGVEAKLAEKGIKKVDADPDVYVSLYGSTREEIYVDTDYWGYTAGPYGRGWGPVGATTTVHTYKVGTLIVDIWDADGKNLLWRGTASDTVSDNPEKKAKKIEKALTKLFAKFPPPPPAK